MLRKVQVYSFTSGHMYSSVQSEPPDCKGQINFLQTNIVSEIRNNMTKKTVKDLSAEFSLMKDEHEKRKTKYDTLAAKYSRITL